MIEAKNTQRAVVRIGYDGRVHKLFQGPNARERFENECRVLAYLETRRCPFVPRLLTADNETLEIVTSNCGTRVERLGDEKIKSIFDELESFGVRHDDAFLRNITYRASDGRFCVIDFEFSTILKDPDKVDEELMAGQNEPIAFQSKTSNMPIDVSWSAMSHPGQFRTNNEDRFLAMLIDESGVRYLGKDGEANTHSADMLFAVADGMGGERSGELAGKIALENITKILPRAYMMTHENLVESAPLILKRLFVAIHEELITLGKWDANCTNMGATLTLVWVHRRSVIFGHIGDTRLYHFRKPATQSDGDSQPQDLDMVQLSEDHTYVGWLRRSGKLNERESRFHPRRNVLSKSLGSGNQFIEPQCGTFCLESGDKLLLCSDGITDGLWERAVRDLVLHPGATLSMMKPAQRLVQSAVQESGRDNSTAIVLEVK